MLHPYIGYAAIFYLFVCICVVPACVMFGCVKFLNVFCVLINVHELVLKMNVENMHGEKIKKANSC